MPPHRFAVGQNVEFIPTRYDTNIPRGIYVITRLLPGDDFDREYRVRNARDGHERIMKETQLRGATLPRS